MKILKMIIVAITLVFIITGCGISNNYSMITIPQAELKDIKVSITPTLKSMIAGYAAFNLTIENNTNNDLEIDWNKTYFIDNGKTSGTFMFEGIVFKDRNQAKSPDIVFANSSFNKTIFPNNFVEFDQYGWRHVGTGIGEKGVYLTIINGNETIKHKATVKIIQQ